MLQVERIQEELNQVERELNRARVALRKEDTKFERDVVKTIAQQKADLEEKLS